MFPFWTLADFIIILIRMWKRLHYSDSPCRKRMTVWKLSSISSWIFESHLAEFNKLLGGSKLLQCFQKPYPRWIIISFLVVYEKLKDINFSAVFLRKQQLIRRCIFLITPSSRIAAAITIGSHTVVIGVIMELCWPIVSRKLCFLPTHVLKNQVKFSDHKPEWRFCGVNSNLVLTKEAHLELPLNVIATWFCNIWKRVIPITMSKSLLRTCSSRSSHNSFIYYFDLYIISSIKYQGKTKKC